MIQFKLTQFLVSTDNFAIALIEDKNLGHTMKWKWLITDEPVCFIAKDSVKAKLSKKSVAGLTDTLGLNPKPKKGSQKR